MREQQGSSSSSIRPSLWSYLTIVYTTTNRRRFQMIKKVGGGGGLRITTERAANEIGEQGRIGLGSKRQLIRDFEESGEEDEE